MALTTDQVLRATTAAITRLKSAIEPAKLAYLLLTGTSENTVRDLLACELLNLGMLPARDWKFGVNNARMKVDIALFDPAAPEAGPIQLIELKWQNSKDCRMRDHRYPYLVNVQRDFDQRAALGLPMFGVVLFTHVLGRPDPKLRQLIRFCPQLVSRWADDGDAKLLHFRDQLHTDYPACTIAPELTLPMCRIAGGDVWGVPVELACWVVEPLCAK
jgi:hypothetical protein